MARWTAGYLVCCLLWIPLLLVRRPWCDFLIREPIPKWPPTLFMSPLWRHSFASWQNRLFGLFSALRKKGWNPYSAWMKYVVCLHLYIPWKFGERGSTPRGATGPSSSVFLFVRHATLIGTESLDGSYTHWTWGNGHKPPGQKHPRTKISPVPDTQQAATYSIAAVAGNCTILVVLVVAIKPGIYCIRKFMKHTHT